MHRYGLFPCAASANHTLLYIHCLWSFGRISISHASHLRSSFTVLSVLSDNISWFHVKTLILFCVLRLCCRTCGWLSHSSGVLDSFYILLSKRDVEACTCITFDDNFDTDCFPLLHVPTCFSTRCADVMLRHERLCFLIRGLEGRGRVYLFGFFDVIFDLRRYTL